jgi:hypothetical protein
MADGIKSHSLMRYIDSMDELKLNGNGVCPYVDELLGRDAVLLQQHATQALLPAHHTQTESNT